MIALWWLVMRKIVRISKTNRITSIADFIVSRYGKSALLGGLVTVIAVIGVMPYIALQLKAVSHELHDPAAVSGRGACRRSAARRPFCADTAFWVALLLAHVHDPVRHARTSTRPSATRGWWRRSRSSRW